MADTITVNGKTLTIQDEAGVVNINNLTDSNCHILLWDNSNGAGGQTFKRITLEALKESIKEAVKNSIETATITENDGSYEITFND